MNKKLIKLLKFLGFTGLLTAIGCDDDPAASLTVMYGMPANFKTISGRTLADLDNDGNYEPVSNIQVSINDEVEKSNENGRFSIHLIDENDKFVLSVKDIDGEVNGSLEDTEIEIDFAGESDIEQDIKLNRKEK